MKKGRLSSAVGGLVRVLSSVRGVGAVLMSLWPPRREDQAELDLRSWAQVQKGGQAARRKAAPLGANSSLRVSMCQIATVSLSGDVDLGDLGAALLAQPALVSLVALGVGRVAEGVHRRLEQRPAQVARALAWRAARGGRTHPTAPPAGKGRCSRSAWSRKGKREISPISAAIVNARTQPTPGTVSSSGT